MTKLLDTLRTPGAMLVALVLALVAQLEHTAQVFLQVVDASGLYAQLHAYAFAAAVEVAVLLFVLAGHKRISYGFALATFATNLSYYAMHDVALLTVAGAPAWLMSALLPCAIMGYSHTIAESQPAAPKTPLKTPPTVNTTLNVLPHELGAYVRHFEAIENVPLPTITPAETSPAETRANERPTAAQRRAQIREQELHDPAQVAAQFGVSIRTAQADLAQVRKATTQTNGRVHA